MEVMRKHAFRGNAHRQLQNPWLFLIPMLLLLRVQHGSLALVFPIVLVKVSQLFHLMISLHMSLFAVDLELEVQSWSSGEAGM